MSGKVFVPSDEYSIMFLDRNNDCHLALDDLGWDMLTVISQTHHPFLFAALEVSVAFVLFILLINRASGWARFLYRDAEENGLDRSARSESTKTGGQ